jgi:hypothetical protein
MENRDPLLRGRLLRARGKRPRRRAADKRDERSPLHVRP